MKRAITTAIFLSFFSVASVYAQDPVVGRKAAAKYFEKGVDPDTVTAREVASDGGVPTDYLLMLHLGSFVGSSAYNWKGGSKRESVGKSTYGVTYVTDQWGALDVALRLDFTEYKLDDQRAQKISLLPLLTFPLGQSRFPFYFGFGAGLGIFSKQVPEESNLSFDYQLVAGLRMMDLAETNAGFFVEFGMKNHILLLSSGQFNGTSLAAGAVWSF